MSALREFGRLLLAEWTKLRSVRRWVITLLGAAVLTLGLSMVAATGGTNVNERPNFVVGPDGSPVTDGMHFVHQPMTGDGTITVRVVSLGEPPVEREASGGPPGAQKLPVGPWGGAGVIVKDGTRAGSSYASVLLTPTHGVRMQADYRTDLPGSASAGTRWLRLTRAGDRITGYESADGATWQQIGDVTVPGLPTSAEIGLFVSAEPVLMLSRSAGSTSVGILPVKAMATFDNLTLAAATPTGAWRGDEVSMPVAPGPEDEPARDPDKGKLPSGGVRETGGTYTVTGSGKIGPEDPPDDMVQISLFGVLAGLMALIAVGVLFATSEFRRGMIRTSFLASPRRGRVLGAKAVVLGTAVYVIGLVSVVAAFLITQPMLRAHGFAPPAFVKVSLTDPAVIRALLLTPAFMAAVAVFSLAAGMIMRRSAAAITTTVVLVILPVIVGSMLPPSAAQWLMRVTLAGGFATQRAKPPNDTLVEPWSMIGPWAGITVAGAYALGALALAWWQLRRRDA
ncbi:ABC transporter permease subunit [Catellatospora paridis]|uniref:ABC transporter permease subunit n=1 Tax=Catellatospora paridis TaxID=1617086 RepID=UPI0012D3B620|nr:ABC transporter permease subunit [Catellatospora paridis]